MEDQSVRSDNSAACKPVTETGAANFLDETMSMIGAYSRPHVLAKIDKRTREARLLQSVRDGLVDHVGGLPSATQAALIERCAWLTLRVSQLDAKMAGGNDFTQHDSNQYLAWNNALRRSLRELGLKGADQKPPDLREYLAARAS